MNWRTVGFVCAIVLVAASLTSAEIPLMINYQGKVTYPTGEPIPDGVYTMEFVIWDADTGGSPLWTSGGQPVDVNGSIFSIVLGEGPQPPIELPFDADYWLEVIVDGDVQSLRKRLTSVGYAYMASGLVPGTEVIGEVTTDTKAAIKGTNLATTGIGRGLFGQSHSVQGRGVWGWATSTTGINVGVLGETASTQGWGVWGWATATQGDAWGVFGQSDSETGVGVYGYAKTTTGMNYAVHAHTRSSEGKAVYARATATTGFTVGVYGETPSNDGAGVMGIVSATEGNTFGVYGEAASTLGHAVHGSATATSGYADGVYGMSTSTDGKGVHGEALATEGLAVGVYGRTASSDGHGVYGLVSATTGYSFGVYGTTQSIQGKGVAGYALETTGGNVGVLGVSGSPYGHGIDAWAFATTGFATGISGTSDAADGSGVQGYSSATTGSTYGVYGICASPDGAGVCGWASDGSGENYGVFGHTNSTTQGWGGYFEGDVHITGSLSKGSGSFLIDHPLDPENKLLRHNFVESPENLLIYRGKTRLGGDGQANVKMPEYFIALTTENAATVHLTPMGKSTSTTTWEFSYEWVPSYESFEIYGQPGRQVSWMVMAVRDDPVIQQLARPVEEEKGQDNKFCVRGRLLYPTAYGYPVSMGKNHEQQERHRFWIQEERRRMDRERERFQDERVRMARGASGQQ